MYYHFKIHREGKGFWAECVELKGCKAQGDSMNELSDNMSEALNLHLSEPEDSEVVFPYPRKRVSGGEYAQIKVDPKVAFAMVIRQFRLERGLTQDQMKKLLGFARIWQYQRLESAKTANPVFVTLAKIKEEFPDFPFDKAL